MEIKQDMDFNDLQNNCWGQASSVLDEIYEADKEDELMSYLEDIFFDDIPTLTEVNDVLAYDWEQIYSDLGISDDEDDEDEDYDDEDEDEDEDEDDEE